jgi:hypothetical protein
VTWALTDASPFVLQLRARHISSPEFSALSFTALTVSVVLMARVRCGLELTSLRRADCRHYQRGSPKKGRAQADKGADGKADGTSMSINVCNPRLIASNLQITA